VAGDPRGAEAGQHAGGAAADLSADELMKILHVVGARPNFMKIAPKPDVDLVGYSCPGSSLVVT
jgi:hypothetical protein